MIKATRHIVTYNLASDAHRASFEELLNNPNVIFDKSKDIQYFFDDKSCRIMAVVYYTELAPSRDAVPETPKEVLTAIEEGWHADDE